jgi:mannose-6-phosphate isomerase-like protein (cupin superfamily)
LSGFRSFHHEYLVTCHHHASDWPNWEMHPNGDEIVALLSGAVMMTLEEADGSHREVMLSQPGSFVLVPRGTWHTAQVKEPGMMLFVTAGEGTQHRPR